MDHLGCRSSGERTMIHQARGVTAALKESPLHGATIKGAIVDPELSCRVTATNADRVLAFKSNSGDASPDLVAHYTEERITSSRICQCCRRNALSSYRHSGLYCDTV